MSLRRNCLQCKGEFVFMDYPSAVKRGRGKFCSVGCSNRFSNTAIKNELSIHVVCESCGIQFAVKPSRYARCKTRFCSMRCRANGMKKACGVCGEDFYVPKWNTKSKYCSRKCLDKACSKRQSGAGTHTWKGGITPQRVKDRNTPEIKAWKRAVFVRDEFTCVLCSKRGSYLVADHFPYPFYKFPDKRLDLDNGRTLCVDCNKVVTYKERVWANA